MAGEIQGDDPQGTLTSQPFLIRGTQISFRVGGGCDIRREYVELVVNGLSVKRVSGQCSERMTRVSWDISNYVNATAQLRLVDASSGHWGHLNFDDVRFSWDIGKRHSSSASSKEGEDAHSQAGAAYTFRRMRAGTNARCGPDPAVCRWTFQNRLSPSTKRRQDVFGWSVAIHDDLGLALVGSPGHDFVDLENYSATQTEEERGGRPGAGAVYIYRRVEEVLDDAQNLVMKSYWNMTEHAKVQALGAVARDAFGSSVALHGSSAFIGAPKGRRVFAYDLSLAFVKFTSEEVVVLENVLEKHVVVRVERTGSVTEALTIGYSTSDLSAEAVDETKYQACLLLPTKDRMGCRDYQQTSGEVTFGIGQRTQQIIIAIMDDECYEYDQEYIQIRIHLPGGVVFLGHDFRAKVRIDDDDFGQETC